MIPGYRIFGAWDAELLTLVSDCSLQILNFHGQEDTYGQPKPKPVSKIPHHKLVSGEEYIQKCQNFEALLADTKAWNRNFLDRGLTMHNKLVIWNFSAFEG